MGTKIRTGDKSVSNLTTEQLTTLTERMNERLAEFGIEGVDCFDPMRPGAAGFYDAEEAGLDKVAEAELKSHGLYVNDEDGKEDIPTDRPPDEPLYYPPGANITSGQASESNGNHATQNHAQKYSELAPQVAATLGPEHVIVTPLKTRKRKDVPQPLGHKGNVLPTREELIAELQRQAMGGAMPSLMAFNSARPGNWATAAAHMQRLGASWEELRQEAGLKPNRVKQPF
jgi:hypothetical protein